MVKMDSASGFTSEEFKKLDKALELANKVLVSDQFKNAVVKLKFTNTRDIGLEVYQRVTGQDWKVPFAIKSYSRWAFWKNKEVANEDSKTGLVTFNRKFFSGQSLPSLVNTIIHEVCHVAGYHHSSAKDYNSVPYSVGNTAEPIAKELQGAKNE